MLLLMRRLEKRSLWDELSYEFIEKGKSFKRLDTYKSVFPQILLYII